MKSLSLISLSLLFCGCHSTIEQKNVKQYTAEQLYNNNYVYGAGFNADETQVLAGANNSGIFNVYTISIADTAMKALTHSLKDSYFAAGYLPGTNNFLYSADQGGNENSHVYLQKPSGPQAKDITPWKGSKNGVVGWSDDKNRFIFRAINAT